MYIKVKTLLQFTEKQENPVQQFIRTLASTLVAREAGNYDKWAQRTIKEGDVDDRLYAGGKFGAAMPVLEIPPGFRQWDAYVTYVSGFVEEFSELIA